MTKERALKTFFDGFGIPAYPATAIPEDMTFPYITYTLITDAFGGSPVSLTVNIWDYASRESTVNAIVRDVENAIGYGGKLLRCDEGLIWLTRGSPWCQAIKDDSDQYLKGRYINVTAEYLTL